MSRHRAEPPPRYRPRYGRIAVLGLSLSTMTVGLLGGLGVLPSSGDGEAAAASTSVQVGREADAPSAESAATTAPSTTPSTAPSTPPTAGAAAPAEESKPIDPVAPPASGEGRRVVFSEGAQRVWLIDEDDEVERTYLVSGSLTDNLQPGTYSVFSRSENAYGIDDSGTMKWFVRFTRGPSGAAIGFHDIPIDDGAPVQTKAQLGTEQSHGCIRQKSKDAKRMWAHAPIGTTVVVV